MTSWEYLRTQPGWIVHYLRLSFWPRPLVLDYGKATADSVSGIVPTALIAALVVATVIALRRRPAIGFLGVWFFAILAPTSSFVPLYGQVAAEHRMYLPLAAVCVLVVVVGWRWWRIVADRIPRANRLAIVPAACAIVALSWETRRRNEDYQSEVRIWDTVIRARPQNGRAIACRAVARLKQGEIDLALADLESIVLRLDPQSPLVHQTAGVLSRQQGELEAALETYTRSIDQGETSSTIYNNRGLVYRDLGRWDEAIADYSRAVALDPAAAITYDNRGVVYEKLGKSSQALADYSRAIELDPQSFLYHFHRGALNLELRHFSDALADLNATLRCEPGCAAAFSLRGEVYEQTNEPSRAVDDYTRALELQPKIRDAWYGRARCSYHAGQFQRARRDLDEFVRQGGQPDPDFVAVLEAALTN